MINIALGVGGGGFVVAVWPLFMIMDNEIRTNKTISRTLLTLKDAFIEIENPGEEMMAYHTAITIAVLGTAQQHADAFRSGMGRVDAELQPSGQSGR